MKLLIATVLPLAALAAGFETGVVAQSDGGAFHRNTIPQVARLGNGQLMAVMGAYPKAAPSTARIATAVSSDGGRTWAQPKILYEEKEQGKAVGDPNMLVDGNTVFVYWTRVYSPNTIKKAWTWAVKSTDNGETWSQPQEIAIPRQYTPGKQHNAIKLADGSYAMGISWDHWPERGLNARTEGEMNLSSGLLLSKDGLNWNLYGDMHVFVEKVTPGSTNGLAEPSIVQLADGEIFMLLRSGGSRHYEARSRDGGITWTPPAPSALIGHNTPTALWRLENTKNDIVAVWNNSPINRFPLCVALSSDGGRTWSQPRILANSKGPQVSYPGLTQTADGAIVAVWQAQRDDGGRDIRYARFTREWVLGGDTK
jgi:predicted neuraminidase